jgi:hypothetical protein
MRIGRTRATLGQWFQLTRYRMRTFKLHQWWCGLRYWHPIRSETEIMLSNHELDRLVVAYAKCLRCGQERYAAVRVSTSALVSATSLLAAEERMRWARERAATAVWARFPAPVTVDPQAMGPLKIRALDRTEATGIAREVGTGNCERGEP